MVNAILQFVLFIWITAYGGTETVNTSLFYSQVQCEYAASIARNRLSVNVAYCIKTQ